MVITSIMAFFVMWKCWQWRVAAAALVIIPFLAVDFIFLAAGIFWLGIMIVLTMSDYLTRGWLGPAH